jgi:predicted acetyltransferase
VIAFTRRIVKPKGAVPVILERVERADAHVLDNLFQLYAHDFSEYVELGIQESGRFDVGVGEEWWSAGHFPFFVRTPQGLAGFALAQRGSRRTDTPEVMDVAEFFVLRGARRLGIGTRAAHALFAAFPGEWEIRVRRANVAATKFWARAADGWDGDPVAVERFSSEGVDWGLFSLPAKVTSGR